MITLRPGRERGKTALDWLDSYHTFSFGDYFDPNHTAFSVLRVMNDDRVQPGMGFGTHGHRDMEIVSYILEGALEHRDSLGTGSVLRRGDVQRMTAGTGIRHSEFNPSATDPVHFLQIWLLPQRKGLPPSYEEKSFSDLDKQDRLRLIASRDGRDGSLTIHQDVDMLAALLGKGKSVVHSFRGDRQGWVQVAAGEITLNVTHVLAAGDGASIRDEQRIEITAREPAEILLFDVL